jgi:hypothetical protein
MVLATSAPKIKTAMIQQIKEPFKPFETFMATTQGFLIGSAQNQV